MMSRGQKCVKTAKAIILILKVQKSLILYLYSL